LGGTPPVTAAAADCQLTLLASADVVYNPGGGVLVPVRIGTRDVWMVLQMATGIAMVNPTAVERLGLKTGVVRTDVRINAGGVQVEREVEPESLLIGNANFAGWKLYVQPGPPRPLQFFQGRPVIGSLSSNFMNAVDMELDLASRKMNLFTHARCRGEQVYWSDTYTKEYLYVDPSGLLYFPMELDGRRVEASLNTQGPRSRLSEEVARQYFKFRRDAGAPQDYAPAGAGRIVGMRPMELTARELALPDAQVHIIDDRERKCGTAASARSSNAISFGNCFGTVPFEMGTDLLQHLRIYIASAEKRIYITRNAPAGAAAAGGGAGAGAAAAPGAAGGATAPVDAPPAAGSAAAAGAAEQAPAR
jgi:hypothetical protein